MREHLSRRSYHRQNMGTGCDCRGAIRNVVLAMLMILVCVDLSMAQTREQQRESLRGLQGVEVAVEDLNLLHQYLSVAVGPEKTSSGQYSFNARVELHRAGSFMQRPQQMSAPTWFTPGMLRTVG
ncbi:MAG: hypothetical protein CAF45_002150 [Nitrospira sp. CG24E]|nr:MAG: hypothetical protein CAF45_002150 [Nitrospira sp. CG24E]